MFFASMVSWSESVSSLQQLSVCLHRRKKMNTLDMHSEPVYSELSDFLLYFFRR